jgi:peptidoglycan-associated lipoprotein
LSGFFLQLKERFIVLNNNLNAKKFLNLRRNNYFSKINKKHRNIDSRDMNLKKIVVVCLTLIMSVSVINNSYAQRNYTEEGDNAFQLEKFYEAINLYKKAYSKVKSNRIEKGRILFQIAECYRLTNDYRKAEMQYKRVISYKYPDPLAKLYYAEAMKNNEKYEEALIQYDNYLQDAPDDPRGITGKESCALSQSWKDNPTRYSVENYRKFNSKENDFSPCYADKKYRAVVFTSSRDEAFGNGYDEWTGQSFTDLFFVTLDKKGNWSKPQLLDEEGIVNSDFNEGASCFNKRANTIFFTRCRIEKKVSLGCEIYSAQKKGRSWGDPEEIVLTTDSFTVGHPTLSANELTMYFASDMPGGYGGKDIWVVRRTKKTKDFGEPENLGSIINTPGNDMFPYLRDNGNLYFSSDYHLGMGGLDIFVSENVEGEWQKPVNMQYPINSAGDDFGIIFNDDVKMLREADLKETGFLTSNRKGTRGGDDLWEFTFPPLVFTLSGVVYDDSTGAVMSGVLVTLQGSDGTNITDSTDETGYYSFDKYQILESTSYKLEVTKEAYWGDKGRETTVGRMTSEDLVLNFRILPIPVEPIILPDIVYPLAESYLTEEAKDSVDYLFQILTDHPTIVIELQSHTDSRPIPMTNDTLSFRRAKSVVDYLIELGIEPGRLKAKGYGDKVPRTIEKDRVSVYKGKEYTFTAGTVLTDEFIDGLSTHGEREAAHQLNRRTTFLILRDDYVPQIGQNLDVNNGVIIEGGNIEEEDEIDGDETEGTGVEGTEETEEVLPE